RLTRGGAIALAVALRTKVRTALEHAPADLHTWSGGIEAFAFARAARIVDRAAGAGLPLLRSLRSGIPVAGPFPDIADHVEQAVAVRLVAPHRRGAFPPVFEGVRVGKQALPVVRQHLAAGRERTAPRIVPASVPAPRGKFPLGLGRKALAGPARISQRVAEGDMDHRMILQPCKRAIGPGRMPPIGSEAEFPPLAPVPQVDRRGGTSEYQRAGLRQRRVHSWIVGWVGRYLGRGRVPGRLDERGELAVGDRRLIDREAVHCYPPYGRFLGVEPLRPHGERAAGNADHAVTQWARRDFARVVHGA